MDDITGLAKQLLFSDLSLASWSNKENNDPSPVMTPKKSSMNESPLLKLDNYNILKQADDDYDLYSESSQDSVLFSPMNLKDFQLPVEEVKPMKKAKVFEKQSVQTKKDLENKPTPKYYNRNVDKCDTTPYRPLRHQVSFTLNENLLLFILEIRRD